MYSQESETKAFAVKEDIKDDESKRAPRTSGQVLLDPNDVKLNLRDAIVIFAASTTYAFYSGVTMVQSLSTASVKKEWPYLETHNGIYAILFFATGAAKMLGALVLNPIQDVIGRRRFLQIILPLNIAFGLAAAWAWSFWAHILFRVVVYFTVAGLQSAEYVWMCETVPLRGRTVGPVVSTAVGTTGLVFLVGIWWIYDNKAAESRSWRYLASTYMLFGLIPLFLIYCFTPATETPRFYIMHERGDGEGLRKAYHALELQRPGASAAEIDATARHLGIPPRTAAAAPRSTANRYAADHINPSSNYEGSASVSSSSPIPYGLRQSMPSGVLSIEVGTETREVFLSQDEPSPVRAGSLVSESQEPRGCMSLFWRILRRSARRMWALLKAREYTSTLCCLSLLWILQSTGSWGMTSYLPIFVDQLGLDAHLTTLLSFVFESPGYILAYILMYWFGRITCLRIYGMAVTTLLSVMAVATACLAKGHWLLWLTTLLFYPLCGPLWTLLYAYSPEVFPTSVRGSAMSLMGVANALPQIYTYWIGSEIASNELWLYPTAWAGVYALFTCATLLLTKETKSKPLADHLHNRATEKN